MNKDTDKNKMKWKSLGLLTWARISEINETQTQPEARPSIPSMRFMLLVTVDWKILKKTIENIVERISLKDKWTKKEKW